MKDKMSRAFALFSLFCGVLLLVALIKFARIDAREFLARLSALNHTGVAVLIGLWFVYTIVSVEKWLLIERHYNSESVLSHRKAFALTALGWVAGQVFPFQVTTAFMRGLGSKVVAKRNAWHSAAATLYEQAFDLAIVMLLGLVSFVCLALHAPRVWLVSAAIVLTLLMLSLQFTSGLIQKGLHLLGRLNLLPERIRQLLSGSGKMLELSLVRRLTVFSIFRFALLCAAAAATTYAAGLSIPPLHLAIAMPLVALASLVPLTPAALGVNEFVFATVLSALGTPFEIGLQWALINRLLVISASLLIGSCGILLLWGGEKISKR